MKESKRCHTPPISLPPKKRILCLITMWFLSCGLALSAAAQAASAREEGTYRIVNVVDDFTAYYRDCQGRDPGCRTAAWERLLESRHPQFFQDAVYRGKTGSEREQYKQGCIRTFWDQIAPRIAEIGELNAGIETTVHEVVKGFRQHLPDFEPRTDFYITLSFSFRGKVVPVAGRDVLAIGLEAFEPSDVGQLNITLAHELFHLYHFRDFSPGGGLYRMLWAEGLATYASAVVVPGYRRSAYLGFPADKMNRCHELLPLLAADFKRNMGQNDHRLKRIYFGAEPNDTQVPPEAGYYLGLLIVENLAREIPLARLAGTPADQVFGLLQRELGVLAEKR